MFGLELLFYKFVHVKLSSFYAGLIGVPLINAVVLVNAGADATGTLGETRARLERLIERTWAIIVIDAGISLITQIGFASMLSTDLGDVFMGVLVMFLAAMLVYAEPFVALEEHVQTLTLIPFAILRSMMLAWVNMSRIFSLFAIQIAVTLAVIGVDRLALSIGVRDVEPVSMGFVALANALLSALFVVAYLDTLAQERASAGR